MTLDPAGPGPRDPEELELAGAAPGAIAATTAMGPVHVTVADLDRSLRYYGEAIGLALRERSGSRAVLGTEERALLVVDERPGARPSDGFTGLFHFALLVPTRADLARWLAHAARDGVRLTGASDHIVSEALYLRDPDGHGIEIYSDRPRAGWEGQVATRITTLPLDLEAILGELDDPRTEPFEGLAAGTVMGHVHLKVADLAPALAFYRDALGFGLMAEIPGQAAFLAAGGYHHHLGANTWESAGAPSPPPGSAALERVTVVLPDAGERDRALERLAAHGVRAEDDGADPVVRDPSGNAFALAVASASANRSEPVRP